MLILHWNIKILVEITTVTIPFTDETQKFTIQVKAAENYPVDLYYLMDLSLSMFDDLEKLKTLGTSIGRLNYVLFFCVFWKTPNGNNFNMLY